MLGLLVVLLTLVVARAAELGGSTGSPGALDSPSAAGIEGTLAYHLATNAAARTRGRTGSSADRFELSNWSYAIFTNANLAMMSNAVWSTNFWLHGVRGLSATCIGYSNGMGGQALITMVSPRHYLCATHMHPENALAAFLDTNNVIHWRTTLERVDVGNDTSVGILNQDLPPSVGYLPVLPANFGDYLLANGQTFVQGIGMNQDMSVFSQPMVFLDPVFVFWNPGGATPFGAGTNWNVRIRGGDSSNPEMFLIGNQLVLVTHNYAATAGPVYAYQISAINRQMHYLSTHNHAGTDYQLTEFPLSNWPVVARR